VYVNDIFDLHLSPNANLMVYADDILLSKPITTSSDLTALQSDLNLISDWLSNNLLTMNVNKTKLTIISRKRPSNPNSSLHPACVYVSGSPLEVVKCFKYLGVWISDDLSWSLHIESVCSRARRLLGFMYRFFSPHCDSETILMLYKSQVLPILDYACVVWDPHLKKDKLLLESVQHFALKIIDRSWHAESNNALRLKYGLPTLEARRSYFCTLTTFKLLNGILFALVVFIFMLQPLT